MQKVGNVFFSVLLKKNEMIYLRYPVHMRTKRRAATSPSESQKARGMDGFTDGSFSKDSLLGPLVLELEHS